MKTESLIGLDLRMWAHPGIGRYIRELFGAMFRLENPERFLYLAYDEDASSIQVSLKGGKRIRSRAKIYSLSEQAELSNFSLKVGLLHVPHFNAPFFSQAKLVVTVHDLIYLKEKRFSGSLLAKQYVRGLLGGIQKNARKVIAVSDFTRRDLEASFPALKGRIRVVYEAASKKFGALSQAEADASPKEFGLKDDYIIFVGSLKAHKNLPVLLDAFESLRAEGKISAQLAIIGRKDPKETALLHRLEKSGDSVRYLGQQPDAVLAALYRGASALVIPSLWEGFGLTAVEAMACGTPVISSDRASLPEVVGEAGLLFDPENTEKLKEHLYNVLTDGALRETLSRKGLERAKRFSWEKAASETLQIYREAMK